MRNEVVVLRAACLAVAERGEAAEPAFHGYELLLRLREAAEAQGLKPMNQATVYRCLRRMEQAGLLHGTWETAAELDRDRPPRRVYTLAADAPTILAEEVAALGDDLAG